jgi:phospholipase/carboxylesterase
MQNFKRICDYDCISVDVDPSAPCVLILHGYGADFQDLAPLSQYVKTSKPLNWVFPNGPLEVPISPFMSGRAWFPIDMEGMQNAIATNSFNDFFSNRMPDELVNHSKGMKNVVDELLKIYPEVIIGGFSQGSMVAMHTALFDQADVSKLFILSGAPIATKRFPDSLNDEQKKIKVFQSHGQVDPVLPFPNGEILRDHLKGLELSLEFHPFNGQHEIPLDVLNKFGSFLTS